MGFPLQASPFEPHLSLSEYSNFWEAPKDGGRLPREPTRIRDLELSIQTPPPSTPPTDLLGERMAGG